MSFFSNEKSKQNLFHTVLKHHNLSTPSCKMDSGPYHMQRRVDNLDPFPHHSSVSAVWNQKWKKAATLGIHPFEDGKLEDFEPVFSSLIQSSHDDAKVFFDPDEYAKPFFPVAESLVARAKDAEQAGKTDEARDLYLRASVVYRIARFPINNISPLSTKAWEAGKVAYLDAARYFAQPTREVKIPHLHASSEAGESTDQTIAALLSHPATENPTGPKWPLVLLISGLDGYRIDQRDASSEHVRRGFACLTLEIPGTGDCPAARKDPKSPDRLWSSVLDWVDAHQDEYGFDASRIVVRGLSTGGYYAMRLAHTHASRLVAVVAQGGGSHRMFDERWIGAQNHMEYPFALANAVAFKFGYGSVEEYIDDKPQQKFSLLENGIFDLPCARLLLINGLEDTVFPIEDSFVALTRGKTKEVRLVAGRAHMGEPEAGPILFNWLDDAIKQ